MKFFVIFIKSENRLDMCALNALCDGVSRSWSGFLSDANFFWLTSIPMGDPFWVIRSSDPLGRGCFWCSSIPRFGNMSVPRRFFLILR